MKNSSSLKVSIIALPIVITCFLLALGLSAKAQVSNLSTHSGCSNRALSGDYGFIAQGVLIDVPSLPPEAQFRSSGVAHFDGKGNLTWQEHTVVNGHPLNQDWVTATGKYSINRDCTGSAAVVTPNSFDPLGFALAVVEEGREVYAVPDTHAITSTFTKINPEH